MWGGAGTKKILPLKMLDGAGIKNLLKLKSSIQGKMLAGNGIEKASLTQYVM